MLADLLLPDPVQFHLDALRLEGDQIILELHACAAEAICPRCAQPSRVVRGRYVRQPRDLPWATRAVQIHLTVRKFRCATPDCPQQIFVERLPTLVQPSARKTTRLAEALCHLGMTAGGEAGARLGAALRLCASPDTLLRLVRRAPLPAHAPSTAIGIDEWAWRKHRQYGTILIDLHTHRVIDLLPDDCRATVTAWLAAHPEITVISRDRSGSFAAAARDGAPQATQVADRFHLMQDLSEVLLHVFERHSRDLEPVWQRPALEAPPTEASPVTLSTTVNIPPTDPPAPPRAAPPAGRAATLRAQRQAQRQAHFDEVHRLAQRGVTHQEIARHVGVDVKTVRRWLAMDAYPIHPGAKRRGRPLGSQLDPYKPHLLARFQEGCRNSRVLYGEIQGHGYPGSDALVRKWLTRLRQAADPAQVTADKGQRRYSLRDLVFSVLRRPDERTVEQATSVPRLTGLGGVIEQACELMQGFAALIRNRDEGGLTAWMAAAVASGLEEFATFVKGIQRDEAAVRAGLRLPWNNGPTEGHVQRLKFRKRSMYGRANFDLLRQRVLGAA